MENNIHLNVIGPDYGSAAFIKKYKFTTVHKPIYDTKIKEKFIKDTDFCLLISQFEGLSMFFMESIKNGKPLIISDGANPYLKINKQISIRFQNNLKFKKLLFNTRFDSKLIVNHYYKNYTKEILINLIKKHIK